jgi:hypothetical protein
MYCTFKIYPPLPRPAAGRPLGSTAMGCVPPGLIPETIFQQVNRLLQECRCQHGQCSLGFYEHLGRKYYATYAHFGLPQRLIDIGMQDQSLVRLVELQGFRRCLGKQRIRTFGQYHFGCVHTAAD